MYFGFALDLSDANLWDIDLLDAELDLLDLFPRRLEDVFSVIIFCDARCIQDLLRNIFKTFSRRFQNAFASHLQDVFKDEKLLHRRPTNISWTVIFFFKIY